MMFGAGKLFASRFGFFHVRRPSSIHHTRAGRTPLDQGPDQALSMAMLLAAITKITSTISRTRNARQRKSVSRTRLSERGGLHSVEHL